MYISLNHKNRPERKTNRTRKLKPKMIKKYPAPEARKRDLAKTTKKKRLEKAGSKEFNNYRGRNECDHEMR